MEVARFHCFPFYRKPLLMYRGGVILESEIFKVFFFKLFKSRRLLRLRRETPLFQRIGECLSSREVLIPHRDIGLIYQGYDATILFEMDRGGREVQAVWRKSGDAQIRREPFLGYPVFYDFAQEEIPHRPVLVEYLQDHWSRVKQGQASHGDMTHYNLLLEGSRRIHAIDEKPILNAPVLTDLFYFYSFFRYSLDKHLGKGSPHWLKLFQQLDALYGEVFEKEKTDQLRCALAEIGHVSFRNPAAYGYADDFKNAILGKRECR